LSFASVVVSVAGVVFRCTGAVGRCVVGRAVGRRGDNSRVRRLASATMRLVSEVFVVVVIVVATARLINDATKKIGFNHNSTLRFQEISPKIQL